MKTPPFLKEIIKPLFATTTGTLLISTGIFSHDKRLIAKAADDLQGKNTPNQKNLHSLPVSWIR